MIQLGIPDMRLDQVGRKRCKLPVLKVDILEDFPHVNHGLCCLQQVSVAMPIRQHPHLRLIACLTAVRSSDFFVVAFVRVS